ncbi:hypothetical protein PQI23_13295 [Leucobacter sp. USCH14]|uniref:hypothetical protein n=1 Tax=Leucobacter sp. USCH14 TaxID=3024838 RepID=UPI00309D54AE
MNADASPFTDRQRRGAHLGNVTYALRTHLMSPSEGHKPIYAAIKLARGAGCDDASLIQALNEGLAAENERIGNVNIPAEQLIAEAGRDPMTLTEAREYLDEIGFG